MNTALFSFMPQQAARCGPKLVEAGVLKPRPEGNQNKVLHV